MESNIYSIIHDWYGMTLPLRVYTRDEDIAMFERDHPEIPQALWEYVNHDVRLCRMWQKEAIDIIVRKDGELKLVQDICFCEAYPDAVAWHKAVFDIIRSSQEVWVIYHDE